MAGFQEIDRQYFPLKDIASIKKLFKQQLESVFEPDLALLSIVVGAVENSMTCNRTFTVQKDKTTTEDNNALEDDTKIPAVEYHIVQALYAKFHAIIKGAVDVTQYGVSKFATRDLVKKVSDVIWNSLTRSYYKDRAHLQSLYSYLTGNKLDCFGVAFAVVAGCQVLGYHDVHLALSEDHAWVVFGEDGAETAEVTWHGKGNEDKRGQPVAAGVGSHSWLYVNSHPVICSRHMEAAALVSAINPNLNPTTDAVQVQLLQQELLWSLYDLGHLAKYPMALGEFTRCGWNSGTPRQVSHGSRIPWLSVSSQGVGETLGHLAKYPMALGNLGELEAANPTPGRVAPPQLFLESSLCSYTYYNNQHVYPYTYQGGYYYQHNMYKEAFNSWANAGDVIRQ
ncbi:unnamed protein product [Timema podura]|uniref:Menin n=1 Tax=Timema podura TaxID=61482 RepID=A0ABN7P9E0_TIMPD|nr:unnamed protein product [Timema podura]